MKHKLIDKINSPYYTLNTYTYYVKAKKNFKSTENKKIFNKIILNKAISIFNQCFTPNYLFFLKKHIF